MKITTEVFVFPEILEFSALYHAKSLDLLFQVTPEVFSALALPMLLVSTFFLKTF